MIRLFHKLDKYLLTHHPLLWSIQLHRLFIWWLPSFLILVGLFLFQDIENRSDAYDHWTPDFVAHLSLQV
jgi:hypothetical protein